MSKRKLAILCSRFPFPIEKGDKLRLYHQLKDLAKAFDVSLFALTEGEVKQKYIDHVSQLDIQVELFKIGAPKLWIAGLQSIQYQLPGQLTYFYKKRIKKQLHQAINELCPDSIYVQLTRMIPYVEGLDFPVVLDIMDAMSLNMKQEAQKHGYLKRILFKRESRLLQKVECSAIKTYSACTIISQRDLDFIPCDNGAKNKVQIIENGVDTAYFSSDSLCGEKQYDIGFVGNMGYQPNVDAVQYLVERILPKMSDDVTVLIAGARPSKSVLSLASDRVEISGWMEDIRMAYKQIKVLVAPIFSGAGQQNKILEAMSMEVPCVTTPQVHASIHAVEGTEINIADHPEGFAEILKNLLNNDQKRDDLAKAGRIFAVQNYNWNQQNNKLISLINTVIDANGTSR